MIKTFTITDFARLFAFPEVEIPEESRRLLSYSEFEYRELDEAEQRAQLEQVHTALADTNFAVAGTRVSKRRWARRWASVYAEVLASRDANLYPLLVPDYLLRSKVLRLEQRYVIPITPKFELHWWEAARALIIDTWLKQHPRVYEFGCGTGHNLAAMALQYPTKSYMGYDYAPRVTNLLNLIGQRQGWDLHGMNFDYLQMQDILVPPGTAIFTVGSLEQTGDGWRPFMEKLLSWEPGIVVHCEPIVEWYNPSLPIDQVAILHHDRRGYMRGLPMWVTRQQEAGRLDVVWAHRTLFGSRYVEGYSLLVWKPCIQRWV